MIDPEEWERRIHAVAEQLQGLSVTDAGAVLTAMLMRLISAAPVELQQHMTMKLAAMLIGEAPPEEQRH